MSSLWFTAKVSGRIDARTFIVRTDSAAGDTQQGANNEQQIGTRSSVAATPRVSFIPAEGNALLRHGLGDMEFGRTVGQCDHPERMEALSPRLPGTSYPGWLPPRRCQP